MDAEAILHELTHAAGLPIEALQAASAQRTELLPKFLGVIDDYLGLEPAARANSTPIFFIFHLLGEWREKAAYRPLARLLRCSADEADVIFGDATAETSHRIMAGVFDGNPQPLYDIILDPHAEEFIRSRMCEALAMITLRGELDRNLVGPFLRDAFNELQPQRHCYVWYVWSSGPSTAVSSAGTCSASMISKTICDAASSSLAKRGGPATMSLRFLGTLSRNCPDGTASQSGTARTGRSGSNWMSLIASPASRTVTRSKASAETTPALAAAERSSRSAACSDQKVTQREAITAEPLL